MSDRQSLNARATLAAPSAMMLLFLAVITGLRLWAAAVIPLTEDEAYYRLWAASPQWGYFDHPPMIAWWIALGRAIAGDTPLGVRLLPVLSNVVTSLALLDLAANLGCSKAIGERAVVWCNATLLIGAGGILAVPDAATVPFWSLTLCCLARTDGRRPAFWWTTAGGVAGLACLSKYSALFLAPGVLLWMLAQPDRLKRLSQPGPWLAVLTAAAVFSPNVAWNAEHHWLTFVKQFGRVAPGRFEPQYLLELLVGQAVLLNPAITAFVLRALHPQKWSTGPNLRLPLITAGPFAAYLALHALHDRVQAHWPVPLYPALALSAAVAADPTRLGARANAIWNALRRYAAPLGLGLSALALIHLALPQTDRKVGRDPADAVRGWPGFAGSIEALRAKVGAGWVGVLSYGLDAELAEQPRIDAPIVQLSERQRYPAADRSWRADLYRPGLIIDLQRRTDPAWLRRCFQKVAPLGDLSRGRGADADSRYAAYAVTGPTTDILENGCPAADARERPASRPGSAPAR